MSIKVIHMLASVSSFVKKQVKSIGAFKLAIIAGVIVVAITVVIMRRRNRLNDEADEDNQAGSGLPEVKYVSELEGSFVLFSSSTCPHCTDMKPEWKKLEDSAPDGVNVLNVEDDEKTFAKAGVMGFPTMALFKDGKAIEYPGERKADAMRAFIGQHA